MFSAVVYGTCKSVVVCVRFLYLFVFAGDFAFKNFAVELSENAVGHLFLPIRSA